jgi:hypothetical protein
VNAAVQRLMASLIDAMRIRAEAFDYLGRQEWERQCRRTIIEHHAAAYFAGQGSDRLNARGDRELGALFQAQFDALSRFGDALERGQLSEAQAQARATLYGGALKGTFSRGQYAIWEIPVHPGEGSPCRSNCKCSIEVRVLDEEELDADVVWRRSAEESCDVCIRRAAGSPYRVRGGVWENELR